MEEEEASMAEKVVHRLAKKQVDAEEIEQPNAVTPQ